MRTRITTLTPAAALTGIWGLLLLAFVIAALYFGRTVIVPIALATLITFLLSRLVTRLERWIGRIAAVLVTVIAMFAIFAAASWVIGRQVIDLADKLPEYQANITTKIRSLRLPAAGPLARLTSSVRALQKEVVAPSPAPPTERAPDDSSTKNGSVRGESDPSEGDRRTERNSPTNAGDSWRGPKPARYGCPGAVAGDFHAVQEGRHSRQIDSPHGPGPYQHDNARDGRRRASCLALPFHTISRQHVLRDLCCYWIAFYWDSECCALGIISGSAAVYSIRRRMGGRAFAGFAVICDLDQLVHPPNHHRSVCRVLEAIVSNFVEPWAYGANTGVSPIALIISAVFWTWLWGPVGLVLSTPLTVCLAVIGRHVPRLEFLGILLSEDQALAPHEEFYHRLLSFSMDSAEEFATKYVETESLTALYDNVLIPAIGAVEIDAHRGSITAEQRTSALQRVHEIIDDFTGSEASRDDAHEQKNELGGAASATGSRVVCLPANAYCDELAGEMLAQLLRNQGFESENVPARLKHEELIDRAVELQPECICVSVVPPTSIAQARHLASAIRERLKSVTILIGVWSARFDAEKLRERLRGAQVSDVAVSLSDAVQRIYKMTAAITDAMLPAPTPPNEEERLAELEGLNLLDTPSEADFDQVTARLTRLFKVPIALVTLVDKNRQWFKSQAGLPADLAETRSTSRDISLCGHVIAKDEVLIVRDLARDSRFANNPFVKERGLRFYAGVPLRGPNGFPIGSLCILDTKPREMSRQEQELLKMIAGDVMEQIKRRPVAEASTTAVSEKS